MRKLLLLLLLALGLARRSESITLIKVSGQTLMPYDISILSSNTPTASSLLVFRLGATDYVITWNALTNLLGTGRSTIFISSTQVTNANFGAQFQLSGLSNVVLSPFLVSTQYQTFQNEIDLGTTTNAVIDPLISNYKWHPTANARFHFGTNSISDTNKSLVVYLKLYAPSSNLLVTNSVDVWTNKGNFGTNKIGWNLLKLEYDAGQWWFSQETSQMPATQIGNGSVTDAVFAMISGLTGDAQVQLDQRQAGPLSGDVITSSASNPSTIISPGSVSYGKIQQTSAGSVLLGRGSSGPGQVQEIQLGANLALSGTTLNAGGGAVDFNVTSFTPATNTPTPLWTNTLSDATTATYEAEIAAGGTINRGGLRRFASFYRAGGGATLIGSNNIATAQTGSALNAYFGASGNDVILYAVGANTETNTFTAKGFYAIVTNTPAAGGGGGSALNTSLVAYYKMDEIGGGRADSEPTGAAQDLAQTGTIGSTPGLIGNAATGFTSGNYLSHADSADLSLGANQPFTVSAWVNASSFTVPMGIVTKPVNLDGNSDEYLLYYDSGSTLFRFIVGNGTSFGSVAASSASTPAINTTYFVVAWYDDVAQTVNIQVNNGSINTSSWLGGTQDTTGSFLIGNAIEGFSFCWDGWIDEVGFWKRVLTSTERSSLYNSGAGITCCAFP